MFQVLPASYQPTNRSLLFTSPSITPAKNITDQLLIAQCNSLQLHCNINHWFFSNYREYIFCNSFNNLCSWIIIFINPVTESHKHLLPVLHILDELRDLVLASDLFQHSQNSFICTSMSGTVKCCNGSCK